MSALPKATKRRDLIARFRELEFTGPVKGVGDHPEFMSHPDGRTVKVPNKHSSKSDIGEPLLKKILAEAHVSQATWLGGVEPDDAVNE